MKQILHLLVVIGAVVLAYIFLMIVHTPTREIIDTVNTTANWTSYPEAQAFMLGWVWWVWFVPAVFGIAAVVYILKFKEY